ncbi:MAG: hypothetical protein JWQ59_1071 [Cryobacterium sp.]|jgi:hypothetical protein|nr:hypothetical protein [Cryobacterium sp.]
MSEQNDIPFRPSPPAETTPGSLPGDTGTGASAVRRRWRPLFATILWGVILLAFAAFMVVTTILPTPPDPALWLLGGVIAIGLVLVTVGIAAVARRAD